jgi:hypothetical protein
MDCPSSHFLLKVALRGPWLESTWMAIGLMHPSTLPYAGPEVKPQLAIVFSFTISLKDQL